MKETNEQNNLGGFFVKSVILHIAILLLFSIQAVFFPSEPISLDGAILVDIVSIQDKLPVVPKPKAKAPEPKKETPKQKPAPKPEPKPDLKAIAKKKAINLQKQKKTREDALKRMRALQKIEEEQEQKEQEAAKQVYKGNQLSKGSQLSGIQKLQYDDYLARLESHIKSFWSIPAWMANLDLRAEISVRISPEGYVISKKITKASGNKSYDDQVVATIERASPFPRPSDKFKDILANEGFRLGFPE
ncbi:MAG: TonB family protein [Bdellovibrionota bacterium]|nr:TonB family protein [Bdellovibrionota bacterium]